MSDSISVTYGSGKSTETESRSGLSGAGEEGIGVAVYGARVSCRGEEKDLQLIIEILHNAVDGPNCSRAVGRRQNGKMIHRMCIFSLSLSNTQTGIEGPGLESSLQIQGQDPLTGPEGMVGQVVDSLASGRSCVPCTLPQPSDPRSFFYYDFYDFNLFWLCCFFVAAASL